MIDRKALGKAKYRNQRILTEDGWFDSKGEYARWQDLKLFEKAGGISDLRRQVKYELIPKMGKVRGTYYIADYVYQDNGKEVVEDHKGGIKTREYILKKRLMLWRHGIEILETYK